MTTKHHKSHYDCYHNSNFLEAIFRQFFEIKRPAIRVTPSTFFHPLNL